ncbi:MAG: ABC transporter permease [Trueperaceae bacterium]|nr:ABC transporter permease [Trueperaceae bacterium]MCC6309489.1 ABC transporter permease [Trueperaceae bacterium]MCO5174561.1 ABC transporter permease [Trueperaceae bacterium]MCW5818924.1 ABC transporter permease [Trueperaceae bacterium]
MAEYLAGRLVQALLVILAVTALAFVLLRVVGDPARLLMSPEGSMADLESIRRALGLDAPLWLQFVRFLRGLVSGDVGTSYTFGLPAFQLVFQRVPYTVLLTMGALLVGVPGGIALGVTAAVNRGSAVDTVATNLAVLGRAVPNFWLAIILILLFGVQLRWLPPSGSGTFRHLIMPAITLATGLAAIVARLTRSSMLEVLRADFVRTAYAKGQTPMKVVYRHAFRNALLPVVTIVGLQMGHLLGGAIITETIFAWPGIGRLLIQSINDYDYPVVQAAVLVIAFGFVALNLLVDLLYALIDPRVTYR